MEFDFGEVDNISKVPEQFRGIYTETDGKFSVGASFKPIAEAVLGLNKSLKAARADLKSSKIDLTPLSDFGSTPDEIKTSVTTKIQELQEELAKGDKAKLNLEKIKQDLAGAHSKEMEKANTRVEALKNQLYGLLVENAATSAITELKGIPELLLPFVKTNIKVIEEDGKFNVYVVDGQGDRRYSGVTGQPLSIKELVSEMKSNEKFGRLFESESAGGTGAKPGSTTRQPQQKGRVLSANEKIAAGLAKGQHKTSFRGKNA